VEKYCRAGQATDDDIQRMRISCLIPKATNTHSEYVILIAFPLRYTYIASLVQNHINPWASSWRQAVILVYYVYTIETAQ